MFDALYGKRILELGNPGFIWKFYEVFRESGSFQISVPPSLDVVLIPVIQYSCCHSTHYIHTPDSKRGIKRRAYFSVPHITSTYLCTEPSHVATLHISVSSHCIPTNHKVAMAYNTKYLFSRIYRLARDQLIWAGLSQALLLQATVAELLEFSQQFCVAVEWLCPT